MGYQSFLRFHSYFIRYIQFIYSLTYWELHLIDKRILTLLHELILAQIISLIYFKEYDNTPVTKHEKKCYCLGMVRTIFNH